MSGAGSISVKITYPQLRWICVCLALALAAHAFTLPIWLLATVALIGAARLGLAARGRAAPARPLRFLVAAASILILFLQFRTFNGLSAGTALLALVAGLKLLETESRRDAYIITLIVYFLCLAALLRSESFWLLAYLGAVLWLTTAALLRLTNATPLPDWTRLARYAGRIMAQSLPLALVLWLFFPRFDGPLWQMPAANSAGQSGLGDTMSPGDITDLALSDDIAFRVHFHGAAPPGRERYWRGPVLHEFDGHTWRRSEGSAAPVPPFKARSGEYRYTLNLEPHQHDWIFLLDRPVQWDAPRAVLNADYMVMEPRPVSQPLEVEAVSYSRVESLEALSEATRERDTRLPSDRNPRTRELAQKLRGEHPDVMGYVTAVLDMFREQAFFYTLRPPELGLNSVDDFLFDTRRGFCGHYASAFANLMRAAGIPTRVVTGYQGGTYNRFADYWIVRQSDAHAWDEIWVDGRGWVRIDPTSAVAPERVERGTASLAAQGSLANRWQQHAPWLADLRLRLDAFEQRWRQRILKFDKSSQDKILLLLRVPEPDGHKLVLVLAAGLSLALLWLTWQVRRELLPQPKDPLLRAYDRLCRRLAAAGLPRSVHEGPEAYAARIGAARPDLAAAVTALCGQYSALRYGAGAAAGAGAGDGGGAGVVAGADAAGASGAFIAQVRAFRPIALRPPNSRGS